MEAVRYMGKIDDGHLSLPDIKMASKGKKSEMILFSLEKNIYSFTERVAKENGFSNYSEEDIEKIIHESRGVR
ncbi:MAG: hypothetical protein V1749_10950 [Candidatus Desantisbacteria bacterium]